MSSLWPAAMLLLGLVVLVRGAKDLVEDVERLLGRGGRRDVGG